MSTVSVPFTFTPGTAAQSAQVNANFAALVAAFNSGISGGPTSGVLQLPGGMYLAWGSLSGVAADGSVGTAVTFGVGGTPFTFPTTLLALVTGISNPFQTNPWQLSSQTTSEGTTGFTLNIAGAPNTGSPPTVNAWYIALGY